MKKTPIPKKKRRALLARNCSRSFAAEFLRRSYAYARRAGIPDADEFAQRVCEHALKYEPRVMLNPGALAYTMMRHTRSKLIIESISHARILPMNLEAEAVPDSQNAHDVFIYSESLRALGELCLSRARDDFDRRLGEMLIHPEELFAWVGDSRTAFRITRRRIAEYLGVSRYVLSRRLDALLEEETTTGEGQE